MKVLVIGSGAREHALVWKLALSKHTDKLYAAPGNPGMESLATLVDISVTDLGGLVAFAKEKNIDLTVVGPEAPLMLGIAEAFQEAGLRIFAPSARAAQIEGSKNLAKGLMQRAGVPTARYRTFTSAKEAISYVEGENRPFVVKADGLAGGKGVVVATSVKETIEAIRVMLEEGRFAKDRALVLLEEILTGPEVSVLAFSDGLHVRPMVWAQDHKRAYDQDMGPNTGGMGAYSPPQEYTDALQEEILQTIFKPIVAQMAKEDRTYIGVLYAGLMLTEEGPKVLEFNARFGDPEAQVVLMRLQSDLVEIMLSCLETRLDEVSMEWTDEATCGVVLASEGYPGAIKIDREISGLWDNEGAMSHLFLCFHAGTKRIGDQILTSGGRVLTVCAWGETLPQAVDQTYDAVNKIYFEGMHYRRDIAQKGLMALSRKKG